MALTSETSKQIFVCTGGTVYTVPFYFLQNADLTVYREDADGAVSTLTITTDYTVTGAGSESGGELTTIATYSDGKLIVVRDVDYTQRLDLIQGDGFRPDTLEQELDRIVMQVQQLARKVGVSFQLPDSDTSGASTVLPSPEAGKVFAWNATGDALVNEVPQYTVVGNGSITEPKLADGAVTLSKIDADATDAVKGIMRFATDAETIAETETAAAVTPAGLGAGLDVLRAAFGGHISGMAISVDTDTKHDIAIDAGAARDATNADFISLASVLTKQIDAAWTAGDDAGGFPSGLTLSANTWYHVFAIKDVTNNIVDAGFDTSLTAANLLADATDYTLYRRVGSVLTDASRNIVPFNAYYDGGSGLVYEWDTPKTDYSGTVGTTEVLATLKVPPVDVVARYGISLSKTDSRPAILATCPDARDTAPGYTNAIAQYRPSSTYGGTTWNETRAVNSQIRIRMDMESVTTKLATFGFKDPRRA